MPGNEEAWIALIGTIFGSAGLKGIESFLGRAKRRDDTALVLRNELRSELTEMREDLREAEHEVDVWRDKYYRLVGDLSRRGIPIDPEE